MQVHYQGKDEKTHFQVTGKKIQLLDANLRPVLQSPDLNLQMVFSSESATTLCLTVSSVQGVLRYPFIMSVFHTITRGEFLMSFYGDDSDQSEVATDYSKCLYLDIHCPSPRLTLPLSDSDGVVLTSREVSVCTGDRCVLFNTIVVTVDALTVMDSVPVLALSQLQYSMRYSDTMTRMNVNADPISMVAAPYTLPRLISSFSNAFMESSQSSESNEVLDNEVILTEVSDSDTEEMFTFTKDPSFAFDVSLRSLSLLLVIQPDDSYKEMSVFYEAMKQISLVEMLLGNTVINYKSSPCDKELDLSIISLSLLDHDQSSLCPANRRHFVVMGSDIDPMLNGKIILVDNASKLFCDVNMGASQIQLTPFLFSLPSLLMNYLPESDSSTSESTLLEPTSSDATTPELTTPELTTPELPTSNSMSKSPASQQGSLVRSTDSGVFGCRRISSPSFLDRIIKASLSLHPIHLFLFSLTEKSNSTSLDFSFSTSAEAHTANNSLTGTLQLMDICVKKVNEPALFSTLLLPTSLSIAAVIENRFNEITLTLTGTPITMVVGSTDIALVLSLYESLFDRASSESEGSPSTQTEEESSLQLLWNHIQLKTVLPLLRLVLVSNSYQSLIPVATLEVQSVALSLQSLNQSITILSRITLCGQVFKKSIGKWELGIEPWQLNGRFDQNTQKMGIRIDTTGLLNLNVTSSILATLNGYYLEVSQALELRHTDLLSMYEVAPRQKENVCTYYADKSICNNNYVCFVNHAGCHVFVDISDGHGTALTRTQTSFVVTDGQALYSNILSYPSFQQLLQSDIVEDSYKEVTIHCDGYSSASFPLYSDCEVCLWPLSPVNPMTILVARSQVSFGRKEILISGRISVENRSGLALFYGFDPQTTASERGFTRPLERFSVDSKVYAPSNCCVSGVLSLSLGASFSIYEQSAVAKIDVNALEQAVSNTFIVTLGRQQQCIRVHVNREIVGVSDGASTAILQVLLLPCLVIQNQLPSPITVTISDIADTRGKITVSP